MAPAQNPIKTTAAPNQADKDKTNKDKTQTTGASKPAETSPNAAATSVQHAEPEDAYLTGGRRNLQRRVLGLNVEAGQAQRAPEKSAGLHSTGSFTGVANGKTTEKENK
jgi:hypothetical protein